MGRQLQLQGQAGVHRVISELALRDCASWLPDVDTGVDLLVEGLVRVQVKATLQASRHHRMRGAFCFTLGKAQTIRQQRLVPSTPRQFSTVCDFVALWAIEPNRFWIVPAPVLDGRWTVQIAPNDAQWREVDVARVRTLRTEGATWAQIEAALGQPARTLRRRVQVETPKRNYADLVQYEGRWDLITEMLGVLRGATAIAGVVSSLATDGVEPSVIAGVEPARKESVT